MNLFFVFGSGGSGAAGHPELSGSLPPGITRDSLLQLAGDAGSPSRSARSTSKSCAGRRRRRDHRGVRLRTAA